MNNKLIGRKPVLLSSLWLLLISLNSICLAETRHSESDMEPIAARSLEKDVRIEVEELHQFFVDWFNGKADQSVFDEFTSRFDSKVHYIGPGGALLDQTALTGFLAGARGIASDFRIAIRDVKVLHQSDSHIIATYTEWQRHAVFSDRPESGRRTTVVLSKSKPFRWLHIHETWLPEEIYKAGPYDF
ncbi:MAG: hypothetical protein GKR93_00230 [Gammaproteobacteria bacterium]|nr:hypothetical protein [Gammaproteobacteria bacterium]